jgi:hypothetical protein
MELFGTYIETSYILVWAIVMGGILYTVKEYGRNQYNEGMSDAICMHHTGTLKYEIVLNENGEEDIEIKINGG